MCVLYGEISKTDDSDKHTKSKPSILATELEAQDTSRIIKGICIRDEDYIYRDIVVYLFVGRCLPTSSIRSLMRDMVVTNPGTSTQQISIILR